MVDPQQVDEIEALGSIYPNEFSSIPESEWEVVIHQFGWNGEDIANLVKIDLQPQDITDESKIYVKAVVIAAMRTEYPTSAAILVGIQNKKGINEEQLEELKNICSNTSEENIGTPSMFLIASAVQEWLQDNNVPGQDGSMYSEMIRRMQRKDVEVKKRTEKAAIRAAADSEALPSGIDEAELEKIRMRQAGEPVTLESFMKWKEKFDEELARLESLKKNGHKEVDESKLSGKQWFLQEKDAGEGDEDNEVEKLIMEGEQEEFEVDEEDEEDEDYVEFEEEEDDEEDYEPSEGEEDA